MRRSLPWLLPFLVAALLTALGATIAAISRRRSR
jgi:hypothetical protein